MKLYRGQIQKNKGKGFIIMKRQDFYYELPEELIAQDPLEDRSSSDFLSLTRRPGLFPIMYLKKSQSICMRETVW